MTSAFFSWLEASPRSHPHLRVGNYTKCEQLEVRSIIGGHCGICLPYPQSSASHGVPSCLLVQTASVRAVSSLQISGQW